MQDTVDGVNLLRLRPRDGFCDPVEHDVVQGAMGVEPGLARHRRSALRAGWIFPVPQLFHFVNNTPRRLHGLVRRFGNFEQFSDLLDPATPATQVDNGVTVGADWP
jgi:hypothetical protein